MNRWIRSNLIRSDPIKSKSDNSSDEWKSRVHWSNLIKSFLIDCVLSNIIWAAKHFHLSIFVLPLLILHSLFMYNDSIGFVFMVFMICIDLLLVCWFSFSLSMCACACVFGQFYCDTLICCNWLFKLASLETMTSFQLDTHKYLYIHRGMIIVYKY